MDTKSPTVCLLDAVDGDFTCDGGRSKQRNGAVCHPPLIRPTLSYSTVLLFTGQRRHQPPSHTAVRTQHTRQGYLTRLSGCEVQVYILTFLIWCLGMTCIGVGGWQHYDYLKEVMVVVPRLQHVVSVFVSLGFSLAFLGIVGMATVITRNRMLAHIQTALVALSLLFSIAGLLHITVTCTAVFQRDVVRDDFAQALSGYDRQRAVHHAVDAIQTKYQCCGYTGAKQWQGVQPRQYSGVLPHSCCSSQADSVSRKLGSLWSTGRWKCEATPYVVGAIPTEVSHPFKKGCQSKLRSHISLSLMLMLCCTALAVAFLMWEFLAFARYTMLLRQNVDRRTAPRTPTTTTAAATAIV